MLVYEHTNIRTYEHNYLRPTYLGQYEYQLLILLLLLIVNIITHVFTNIHVGIDRSYHQVDIACSATRCYIT